jgi:hypothetical protein
MKAVIVTICLIAVSALLVATNPSMDDYQDQVRKYVVNEVVKKSQKSSDEALGLALGPLVGKLAGGLVGSLTTRHDYLLFSIYVCEFKGERLRLLGVLKNFIVLETPKKMWNLHKQSKLEDSNAQCLLFFEPVNISFILK